MGCFGSGRYLIRECSPRVIEAVPFNPIPGVSHELGNLPEMTARPFRESLVDTSTYEVRTVLYYIHT
jgi:hypothetical protein